MIFEGREIMASSSLYQHQIEVEANDQIPEKLTEEQIVEQTSTESTRGLRAGESTRVVDDPDQVGCTDGDTEIHHKSYRERSHR